MTSRWCVMMALAAALALAAPVAASPEEPPAAKARVDVAGWLGGSSQTMRSRIGDRALHVTGLEFGLRAGAVFGTDTALGVDAAVVAGAPTYHRDGARIPTPSGLGLGAARLGLYAEHPLGRGAWRAGAALGPSFTLLYSPRAVSRIERGFFAQTTLSRDVWSGSGIRVAGRAALSLTRIGGSDGGWNGASADVGVVVARR
jgi:hypothetical protein